jgi:integrase
LYFPNVNPVGGLERGERPALEAREKRVLTASEVARLLDAAPDAYRTLLATAAYTGLRVGELLGLTWTDIDFTGGFVHVRKQVERGSRERVAPKTRNAVRDVVLVPGLARILNTHRENAFARGFAQPHNLVFCTSKGTPLNERNVAQRGLGRAVADARLDETGKPPVTMHSLRHGFASHLILDLGLDVVQVSRLLGHARPSITSDVYAHLFAQARHADDIRRRIAESEFGRVLDFGTTVEQAAPRAESHGSMARLATHGSP